MVVFRIFSNLLRMGLGVLFLPLRLIGLPLAIVMLPVKLIMRNFMLVAIVVTTILVYRSCTNGGGSGGGGGGSSMSQLTPIKQPKQAPNRGKGPIVIDQVTRVEDGDSAFATDVYGTMSDEERAAYSQNFFWAMTNLPDGQAHDWSSYNIAGSLRPNTTFATKTNTRCRTFNEVLKVHEVQQTISGTACDNGGGTWCKLKPNATAACNLGQPAGGLFDGLTGSIKNLF